MAEERIQKILARAGISSRRAAEELIEQGRVTVNGNKVTLGMSANADTDDIRLDGQRIHMPSSFDYFLLNKPRGVISDEDVAKEHESARDLIPVEGHLYPVGRLDLNSEGLMLFTNDGALAHRLTHPRYDHPKTYEVIVDGNPSEDVLDQWRRGIVLEGKRTRPAEVSKLRKTRNGTVLEVMLREGRKRQIRKVAARLGVPVLSLTRTKLGPLVLGDLPVGAWRRLTSEEVNALQSLRELPEPRKPRAAGQGARTGGKPGTRRPLPKGTGARSEDRGSSARRPRRSDETEGSGKSPRRPSTSRFGERERDERPSRPARRWPSEERRGTARSEAQADEERGRPPRRPSRFGERDRDERPSRPAGRGKPSSGTRSGERGGSSRPPRPSSEGREDRPSRPAGRGKPPSGERSGEDRPSRPAGRGKPASGERGGSRSEDRPRRSGEGRPPRSGNRPTTRGSDRPNRDRPSGGRPAGGSRTGNRPGKPRRSSSSDDSE